MTMTAFFFICQEADVTSTVLSTNVRFWHFSDLPRCPHLGRYRGETGHGAGGPSVAIDPKQ